MVKPKKTVSPVTPISQSVVSSPTLPPQSVIGTIAPWYVNVPEAAKILCAAPFFVEQLCRSAKLPARKWGKSWVIYVHDLKAWSDAHRNDPHYDFNNGGVAA
jgi:hypothetical protein